MIARLTTTPLLYTIGAMLLVIGVLGWTVRDLRRDVAAAEANQATAEAKRDTAITEREAWKGKAQDAERANTAWRDALALMEADQVARRAAEAQHRAAGQRAVEAARASLPEIETELDGITRQLQVCAARPAYAQARQQMEAACPELRSY